MDYAIVAESNGAARDAIAKRRGFSNEIGGRLREAKDGAKYIVLDDVHELLSADGFAIRQAMGDARKCFPGQPLHVVFTFGSPCQDATVFTDGGVAAWAGKRSVLIHVPHAVIALVNRLDSQGCDEGGRPYVPGT